MPDVYCIVNKTIKLSEPSGKVSLSQPLAYDNALAHAIRVTVVQDDGTPEYLDEIDAVGSFVRSDGKTVTPIIGTVFANVAEIILPQSCYVSPGRFKCTLNLTQLTSTTGVNTFDPAESYEAGDLVVYGGIVFKFSEDHEGAWTGEDVTVDYGVARTVIWVEGTVERNITNEIIDPGTPFPNITQAISNATNAAGTATTAAASAIEAAEEASAYSESVAPDYDDIEFPIAAYHQMCWHEGQIYINNVDIATSEVWTAAHWTETDVSAEIAQHVRLGGPDIATVSELLNYLEIT